MRTASPGVGLAVGVAAVALAAAAPAGVHGKPIPAWSWVVWAVVLMAAVVVLRATRGGVVALRPLVLLLTTVLLLTLPPVIFATAEHGPLLGVALVSRALATAIASVATVAYLGPVGLVAGLRALRLPGRFVDVVHAMLVSLSAIVRHVTGMLRATTARGTGRGPWSGLAFAPSRTVRGFARVTSASLLRSLERAEALERARRARTGDPR
jgi:energy-coupling factor transporter transmembrane protein EcfT